MCPSGCQAHHLKKTSIESLRWKIYWAPEPNIRLVCGRKTDHRLSVNSTESLIHPYIQYEDKEKESEKGNIEVYPLK